MSPHLSQLNVAMAHRNYFRRNNLRILKLATLYKDWIGNFLDWKGLPNVHFILSTQNIKFHWIVMKIKKFLLPIWWYNRDLFPLRNEYNVVFILNGLRGNYFRTRDSVFKMKTPLQIWIDPHSPVPLKHKRPTSFVFYNVNFNEKKKR